MLNPYSLLTPRILEGLLQQPMYFVRQEYRRGAFLYDSGDTVTLLLSHYPKHEIEKERAERHMRLLLKDSYRFLYDSTIREHLEKLKIASLQPEGYRIYINLMATKWKASPLLKLKISGYVRERLPWWDYTTSDKLKVTLKERYGELFLALLWRGQQTEVLLEEIEKFTACVMT
ncbi:MAG TPA: hypothetical protein VMZ03_08315 [Chitinophagaceae bacterium]|nr:hypothetical protein [Chitinophagaceae bacterium]